MNPVQRRAEVLANILAFAGPMGYGLVSPHLILAQADLESGGFTNRLAVEGNNVFSMKMPRQRQTTAVGTITAEGGAVFARYASLADGVRDYFIRQRYFNVPNTSDPVGYMVATVESGYATDPNYLIAWAQRADVALPPVTVPAGGDAGTDDDGGSLVPVLLIAAAIWTGSH